MNRLDYALEHINKFENLTNDKSKTELIDEINLLKINIYILLGKNKESVEVLDNILQNEEKKEKENKKKSKEKIERNKILKYMSNKNLGHILFKMRDYDKAESYFNKAIEIEDKAEIYYEKGLLEFQRENFKKATEDFSKAINKGFTSEDIYFKRAYSFFKNKELDSAKNDFKEVIKKYPEGQFHEAAVSFLDTINIF
jgi:tetratricopeptide (TPR) repeat protein